MFDKVRKGLQSGIVEKFRKKILHKIKGTTPKKFRFEDVINMQLHIEKAKYVLGSIPSKEHTTNMQ